MHGVMASPVRLAARFGEGRPTSRAAPHPPPRLSEAFQADDEGSIPFTRSTKFLPKNGHNLAVRSISARPGPGRNRVAESEATAGSADALPCEKIEYSSSNLFLAQALRTLLRGGAI